jgi:hypothetical protein
MRLKILFAPGHASSNVTIVEEKNNGIFVGDTPGLYLAREKIVLIPSPFGSDLKQTLKSLKMLMEMPAKNLFLGHFGVCDTPKEILKVAFEKMEQYLAVASEIMERTKSSEDLFNHIDGGAELYLEFGFERLRIQAYTYGKAEISLEVYEMTGPASALGVISSRRGGNRIGPKSRPGIRARKPRSLRSRAGSSSGSIISDGAAGTIRTSARIQVQQRLPCRSDLDQIRNESLSRGRARTRS